MELLPPEPNSQEPSEQQGSQELRDVKLHLAVLAAHLGQSLSYNIYFDNKLIVDKGQPVTERLVAHLRLLDPARLSFRHN